MYLKMKLFLAKLARDSNLHNQTLEVDRLPSFGVQNSSIVCSYRVYELDEGTYLLQLNLCGEVRLNCLRCLKTYDFHYETSHELAITENEDMAEHWMEKYETIVCSTLHLDLQEVVTDCLHLDLPEVHASSELCDADMIHHLTNGTNITSPKDE